MSTTPDISPDFPFDSQFVSVEGAKMHYIERGSGDPILFLHGNPTSSYLWRNIIPHLSPLGRCIAPDLIGMGRSDKPRLPYGFGDHYRYIEGFIRKLDLKNICLVVHDWGSALGFHHAMQNPDNIRGIAFMEALIKPLAWSDFPGKFRLGFKIMRTPVLGWFMVSVMNAFIKKILPQSIVRRLTPTEMAHYEAPFPTIASRKPIRRWPCEIPIDGQPADVFEIMNRYNQKLQDSQIPKLLLAATPGAIMTAAVVKWCRLHLSNLKIVDLGKGLHYLQEDHPHEIGRALANWYQTLGSKD